MRVVWSKPARSNLSEIVRYIKRDDERAARRVFERIWNESMTLDSMHERGRFVAKTDSWEHPFPPWPYILGYRQVRDEIRILYVRHGARNWTPSK